MWDRTGHSQVGTGRYRFVPQLKLTPLKLRLEVLDSGLVVVESELAILESGHILLESGQVIFDQKLAVLNLGLVNSELGLVVLELKLTVPPLWTDHSRPGTSSLILELVVSDLGLVGTKGQSLLIFLDSFGV